MPCKRVFLSIGAPLRNLEGIRLLWLFEGKVVYLGSSLDPEDIKNLENMVLRRKP